MAESESPSTYDVGYGKPPKNARFRKGKSGNPKGRPSGTRNLATVLQEALKETVIISDNGVRRTVTKLELAVHQLVNKAAEGDLQAMRQLATLANSAESEDETNQTKSDLTEADQQIVQRLLKKLQGASGGEDESRNK